ncbi:twin-arginine translocation signal domain-containing protein [Skermanella sp. TT6]|uniref:Twin-arginine translocation signal domain-containing protein n=1 Tax=Skermanella cutis TaxID=2775420 RepID=A0ABX7BAT4_9PROT|nr:twin-arginine translocation signal domain-containing protein [Skermanella sp. TT6]QQP91507.1 twin-arginine translocation signal domain-containing protein [Skermanella sp. TT6]
MRTIDKRVKVTRRNFLKSGAAAAGVTALASGTVAIAPSGAWAMTAKHLKPATMVTLVRMARDLYPHDRLGEAYYARAVEPYDGKAGENPDLKQLIEDGVVGLDTASQAKYARPYADVVEEGDRVAVLKSIESTPFFQKVRGDMVVALYNQPEVWVKFGYEGSSAEHGGYLERGFDDIDWLKNA